LGREIFSKLYGTIKLILIELRFIASFISTFWAKKRCNENLKRKKPPINKCSSEVSYPKKWDQYCYFSGTELIE
jgi:hypothetical protein